MRLLAISDLHIAAEENRRALEALPAFPDCWLILAGDIGETAAQLDRVFATLGARFAQLIWVPGNHELWTTGETERGEAKYRTLVEIARRRNVLTPEDPYALWPQPGPRLAICPLFLLYDYSFRPADVPLERVCDWAAETRAVCADEILLDPTPFPSRAAWCDARCASAEARLAALPPDTETVLINHYPLRQDLVRIPRVPRFSPWCGTRYTEDWHRRFHARVAISGHLHVRRTDWRHSTRFEEVSLGYPRDWDRNKGIAAYLREILPGPPMPAEPSSAPSIRHP